MDRKLQEEEEEVEVEDIHKSFNVEEVTKINNFIKENKEEGIIEEEKIIISEHILLKMINFLNKIKEKNNNNKNTEIEMEMQTLKNNKLKYNFDTTNKDDLTYINKIVYIDQTTDEINIIDLLKINILKKNCINYEKLLKYLENDYKNENIRELYLIYEIINILKIKHLSCCIDKTIDHLSQIIYTIYLDILTSLEVEDNLFTHKILFIVRMLKSHTIIITRNGKKQEQLKLFYHLLDNKLAKKITNILKNLDTMENSNEYFNGITYENFSEDNFKEIMYNYNEIKLNSDFMDYIKIKNYKYLAIFKNSINLINYSYKIILTINMQYKPIPTLIYRNINKNNGSLFINNSIIGNLNTEIHINRTNKIITQSKKNFKIITMLMKNSPILCKHIKIDNKNNNFEDKVNNIKLHLFEGKFTNDTILKFNNYKYDNLNNLKLTLTKGIVNFKTNNKYLKIVLNKFDNQTLSCETKNNMINISLYVEITDFYNINIYENTRLSRQYEFYKDFFNFK